MPCTDRYIFVWKKNAERSPFYMHVLWNKMLSKCWHFLVTSNYMNYASYYAADMKTPKDASANPTPPQGTVSNQETKHAPTHTQNKPTWGGGTRLRENHHTVWDGNNGKYWEWNICPHQWEHKQLSSEGDCWETAMSVTMSQNSWMYAAEKQPVLLSKGHCGYCVCVCVMLRRLLGNCNVCDDVSK